MDITQIGEHITFREFGMCYTFPKSTNLSIFIEPIKEVCTFDWGSVISSVSFKISLHGSTVEINDISNNIPLIKFIRIANDLEKLDKLYANKIRCFSNKIDTEYSSREYKYWSNKEAEINKEIKDILDESDIIPCDWDISTTSKIYLTLK